MYIRMFYAPDCFGAQGAAVQLYRAETLKEKLFKIKKFLLDKLYFKDYHPFRSILKEYI